MRLRSAILSLLMAAVMIFCVTMNTLASSENEICVMIYMCGSNLESEYGAATSDLEEILSAGFDTDRVHVLIMAGGSASWNMGFDPSQLSVLEVGKRGLKTIWTDEASNMGDSSSLKQLLDITKEKYPYCTKALILWDHGGGPMNGVCYDELYKPDTLSIAEIAEALDGYGKLSWIGFDACLMGSVEVAQDLARYADYMIASQEKEPESGWNYSFLNGLENDANGGETGKRIIDAFFDVNADTTEPITLSCIRLGSISRLTTDMDHLFLTLSRKLTPEAFPAYSKARSTTVSYGRALYDPSEDYDLADMGSLAGSFAEMEPELADTLQNDLDLAVVYHRSNIEGATGLSVYHPFYNKKSNTDWRKEYRTDTHSAGYSAYLTDFTKVLLGEELASWRNLVTREVSCENGTNVFSLQLTPEQVSQLSDATLLLLLRDTFNGHSYYMIVYETNEVSLDETGLLTAAYNHEALYAVNDAGEIMLGPIDYRVTDNGDMIIGTMYEDQASLLGNFMQVLYTCRRDPDSNQVSIISASVYDDVLGGYTSRVPVQEILETRTFTDIIFIQNDIQPTWNGSELIGCREWNDDRTMFSGYQMDLPADWHLEFREQTGTNDILAAFQLTDVQNNVYSSVPQKITVPEMVTVTEEPMDTSMGHLSAEFEIWKKTRYVKNAVTVTNTTDHGTSYVLDQFVLNGNRYLSNCSKTIYGVKPGETVNDYFSFSNTDLLELDEIRTIDCRLTETNGDDYSETVESYLHFDIHTCLEEEPERSPLTVTDDHGNLWELKEYHEENNGNYLLTFLVTNEGTKTLPVMIRNVMINDIVFDVHTETDMKLTPGCSTVISAESENRIFQSLLDRDHFDDYYLAVNDILSDYGVNGIQSFSVINQDQTITWELPESIPYVSRYEPATSDTIKVIDDPLLKGELCAAETVLSSESDCLLLRCRFTNLSDTSRQIVFTGELNGIAAKTGDSQYSYETYTVFTIPAKSRQIVLLKLNGPMNAEPLENFTMCFSTAEAENESRLTLSSPAGFRTDSCVLNIRDIQGRTSRETGEQLLNPELILCEENEWPIRHWETHFAKDEPDGVSGVTFNMSTSATGYEGTEHISPLVAIDGERTDNGQFTAESVDLAVVPEMNGQLFTPIIPTTNANGWTSAPEGYTEMKISAFPIEGSELVFVDRNGAEWGLSMTIYVHPGSGDIMIDKYVLENKESFREEATIRVNDLVRMESDIHMWWADSEGVHEDKQIMSTDVTGPLILHIVPVTELDLPLYTGYTCY